MNLRRPHRPVKSTVLAIGVGFNLFVAMLTVFSAYGGTFNPEERVIASMAAMVLPALLALGGALFIVNLFFDRRLDLILLGGWLVSMPSILVFSPLRMHPALDAEEKVRSFTFMTYNVLHLWDFRGENPDLKQNATLSYILATDPDIVNIQELEDIDYAESERWHISRAQLDSLESRYPYHFVNVSQQLALFSKYPAEQVEIHVDPTVAYTMACFRLDVMGHKIHLMNVHLKSIGLTPEDKTLYKSALDIPETKKELKRELKEVKSQLLSKLAEAFRERAVQAQAVRSVVDSIGGPFIVAGDFNDIPDCYAVRTIRRDDMHDAYADAAFGPAITYHGDRFYFRIDQVLYRGPFRAVDIERGDISSSDHNPLLTTFLFDKTAPVQEPRH